MFVAKKFCSKNLISGFTLIELVIAVIIIAVLASLAAPIYFRSVETAHAAEADMWLNNVVRAQQRYQVRRAGLFSNTWYTLDIAPESMLSQDYYQAASYCLNDAVQPLNGDCVNNGFKITLYGRNPADAGVVAERVNDGRYSYKLARFYDDEEQTLYCAAGAEHPENDRDMCALILGLETYDPDMEYAIVRIENASSEVSAPSTDEEE